MSFDWLLPYTMRKFSFDSISCITTEYLRFSYFFLSERDHCTEMSSFFYTTMSFKVRFSVFSLIHLFRSNNGNFPNNSNVISVFVFDLENVGFTDLHQEMQNNNSRITT